MTARWSPRALFTLWAVLALGCDAQPQSTITSQPTAPTAAHSSPPVAPVKPVVDDFFGIRIADPYRYMESQNDPEVQAWMKAQDAFTRSILEEIPGRNQLFARIKQLDLSVPQVVAWQLRGGKYLVQKVQSGENTPKALCEKQSGRPGQAARRSRKIYASSCRSRERNERLLWHRGVR